MENTMLKTMFKLGDRVKLEYISDNNKHNGEIGIITDLRCFNYYPNGDYSIIEKKLSGIITYNDGLTEEIVDFYRKGSGLVSPITKIN